MERVVNLLFLHGVGAGDPGGRWRTALDEALSDVGYPTLEDGDVHVIAPRYADLLHGIEEVEEQPSLPPVTITSAGRDVAKQQRRDFEARISALEHQLGKHARGNGAAWADTVVDFAVGIPYFGQARNYLNDTDVRAQVLTRILKEVPDSGRIVIVAHSLGSVIAADLLLRLPVDLEVVGLVTVGSPLGNFDVEELRKRLVAPPPNLGWWVNFWSRSDPVAAMRGVSSVFPWLLDLRVPTTVRPVAAHDVREYLSDPFVGEAVGYGLYGSRSRDLAVLDEGVDVTLDPQELAGVQALRYAHLIRLQLKGEQRERFTGALRQVQTQVVSDMIARARAENRPVAGEIRHLDVDPQAPVPEPSPIGHQSKEHAVVRLLALADQNILRPFEIEVSEEVRREAMRDLTAEMGLTSSFGTDIFDALTRAGKSLPGSPKLNWVKVGVLGIGALALIVGTGGLALAPTAGLAGAAAVTSALATFGPGGMIGGLITAGTLVSAGAGGIAVGIMSPASTAESVEALVKAQLALVILRDQHDLDYDDSIWLNLRDAEITLTREHERLAEFCDPKAAVVAEIRRKLDSVTAALTFMSENNLAPLIVEEDTSRPGPLNTRSWRFRVLT